MKILIFSFLSLFLILSNDLDAQPGKRMKERIKTMKKLKMLEVLELTEEEELEFIVEYNKFENQLEEAMDNFNEAERSLFKALQSENEKEIKAKTEEFVSARTKIKEIDEAKMKFAKTKLNPKNYAKFLIFEKRFKQRLAKHLIKRKD